MQSQSNDKTKPSKSKLMIRFGIQRLWLFVLLVVPVLIVFYYEGWALGLADPTPIKASLLNVKQKLQGLKNGSSHEIQKSRLKLEGELMKNDSMGEKLINLYESIFQSPFPLVKLSSYYRSHFILNVRTSTGFLHQISRIQQTIMRQLFWLNAELQMGLNIIRWQEGIDLNSIEPSLIVVVGEFKMESIDENIALKLKQGQYRNPFYLKQIVQELRAIPSFSHCKFTSQSCQQASVLFLKHNQQKKNESFWEADSEIYFLDETNPTSIFNVLSSILHLSDYLQLREHVGSVQLLRQIYKLRKEKSLIEDYELALNYISFILQQRKFDADVFNQKLKAPSQAINYIKNGEFVSPYMHTQQQQAKISRFFSSIQNLGQKYSLEHSILDDREIGIIDSFPNDFKIGVYLPLLVIFLYPCFMIRL